MMDMWLRQSLNGSDRGRVTQGAPDKCGGMQGCQTLRAKDFNTWHKAKLIAQNGVRWQVFMVDKCSISSKED